MTASTQDVAAAGAPYADRALAVRRPAASVVGAPRTAAGMRRHHALARGARSSVGGARYNAQNEFPVFAATGDVEVLVRADGQERRYVLHRLILAQNSGFFAASTSLAWRQQAGTEVARTGEGRASEDSGGESRMSADAPRAAGGMLRYELDWGSDESDRVPMLVQKRPQASLFGGGGEAAAAARPARTRTKPPPASNALFRSLGAMQSALHLPSTFAPSAVSSSDEDEEPSDTIRDYDNLFRVFYNYPPSLDALDITEAYIQSKTLLALADQYDAQAVVGPRVDHHLLTFQGRLWKQVAKYPPSYLKLGCAARSRAIFQEALVHVVGQWPAGAPQLRTLPASVHDLIEDKAADLDDLKARVEAQLFRLSLPAKHGPGRVSPHSAWWDWQAVALFRSWLADNVAPPAPAAPLQAQPGGQPARGQQPAVPARGATLQLAPPLSSSASAAPPVSTLLAAPLTPAPGRVFRLLGLGGPAYLGHDECKRFVRAAPGEHPREAVRRLERRLDQLKEAARDAVRPLLRNGLELEAGQLGGLGYLTCTRVEEGEWPWD